MKHAIERGDVRKMLKLYLVMGSTNCRKNPVEVLREAIDGGITAFQYREKGEGSLQGMERLRLGSELREICRLHAIPFIVNDQVDLALELDADGIHLGQEDQSLPAVRQKLGKGRIIGISAHDVEEAEIAVMQGANYLGVGPMYATRTKQDAHAVKGPSVIQQMRAAGIGLPIVGIGGIAPGKARPVMVCGADGIAVISAISESSVPRAAAGLLLNEVSEGGR